MPTIPNFLRPSCTYKNPASLFVSILPPHSQSSDRRERVQLRTAVFDIPQRRNDVDPAPEVRLMPVVAVRPEGLSRSGHHQDRKDDIDDFFEAVPERQSACRAPEQRHEARGPAMQYPVAGQDFVQLGGDVDKCRADADLMGELVDGVLRQRCVDEKNSLADRAVVCCGGAVKPR